MKNTTFFPFFLDKENLVELKISILTDKQGKLDSTNWATNTFISIPKK